MKQPPNPKVPSPDPSAIAVDDGPSDWGKANGCKEANEVVSSTAKEDIGPDVYEKLGGCTSNCSRVIRLTHFVVTTNNEWILQLIKLGCLKAINCCTF